jgi:hypothetical protein
VFGIPLYEPLALPECAPHSEDSTLLPDMFWDLTGLRVVYTPVNMDCQHGMLTVETAVLQRLRGAEKAKAEANEPTL